MDHRIDDEVPESYAALIPVRINSICVRNLVCDHLMQSAAFELHLFLKELVFSRIAFVHTLATTSRLLMAMSRRLIFSSTNAIEFFG